MHGNAFIFPSPQIVSSSQGITIITQRSTPFSCSHLLALMEVESAKLTNLQREKRKKQNGFTTLDFYRKLLQSRADV